MSTEQKQVQGQPQIIWDCPSCNNDDAHFYRKGLMAGTAKCKQCGHVWKWKKQDENAIVDKRPKRIDHSQRKALVDDANHYPSSLFGADTDLSDLESLQTTTTNTIRSSSRAQSARMKVEEDHSLAKTRQKLDSFKKLLSSMEIKPTVIIKREMEEDVALEETTKPKKQRTIARGLYDRDIASESVFERWPKKQLPRKRQKRKPSDDEDSDDYNESYVDQGVSSESEFGLDDSDKSDGFSTPDEEDHEEERKSKRSNKNKGKGKAKAKPKAMKTSSRETLIRTKKLEQTPNTFNDGESDGSDDNIFSDQEDFNDSPEASSSQRSERQKTSSRETTIPTKKLEQTPNTFNDGESDGSDDNIFSDQEDFNDSPEASSSQRSERQIVESKDSSRGKNHSYTQYKPSPYSKYTPFMLFNKENRKRICDENPGIHNRQISTKVSEVFRSLPPEEREKYEKESKRLIAEVRQESGIRGRNERMPGNGYIQYCKSVSAKLRQEHPEYTLKDVNAVIGSDWKKLSAEEKQKFNDLAAKLRKEFVEKNPEYTAAARAKKGQRIRETKEKNLLKKKP
ncbi:hypothetical protein BDB00DRAFT_829024 [Zychaea mexicana]|uniref:uncharacterized protein n=1 Tax=Zychaea mexicana TaxID=64656 RepID=UPI0022FEA4E4|nr:uncharacterized protein BDB00DRAFT_829024 [Zychaea mexicana]KAI9492247.1 hypothetical protein BDB00DRAFT_829024 [Zychaea mexicana]